MRATVRPCNRKSARADPSKNGSSKIDTFPQLFEMAALLPDWEALAKDVVKLPAANQCKICKKTIEKPFRCPQCKLVNYCSKACAMEGWPMHKAQCGVELPKEMDQDMWEKSLRETATTKRQELCQIS